MGIEEKLPSGVLLTSVEKLAGWARARSVWPATFGLACCAIELFQAGVDLVGHLVEVPAVRALAGGRERDGAHEPAEAGRVADAVHPEGAAAYLYDLEGGLAVLGQGDLGHRSRPFSSRVVGASSASASSATTSRLRLEPSLVSWICSWIFSSASLSISGRGGQPGR